jgi:hypothetical protein
MMMTRCGLTSIATPLNSNIVDWLTGLLVDWLSRRKYGLIPYL